MWESQVIESGDERAGAQGERSVSSPLRISWRSDEPRRAPTEPSQALHLLRRQLTRLEEEILGLHYSSPQAAAWEAATVALLNELFPAPQGRIHPNAYRFKYASPAMELSPGMQEWQLQNHYVSLQKTRQWLLGEFLKELDADNRADGRVPATWDDPVGLVPGAGSIQGDGSQEPEPAVQEVKVRVPTQAEEPVVQQVDTFIFSDLHLGSDVSRSKELLRVLQTYSFRRLILLGDIFDDLNFKRLRRDHWEMLSWLRKLSDPDRKVEIVWILGNHDLLLENVSRFIGIEVRDKYSWEHNRKRFLAIHGHQFDRFLEENVVISEIATFLYLLAQKLDTKRHRFSRFLKRLSKKWLRLSHQVALRAARYGRAQGADYVFCGHTHRATFLQLEGVGYYNTGCWTDVPSHFITIDDANGIQLHEHE